MFDKILLFTIDLHNHKSKSHDQIFIEKEISNHDWQFDLDDSGRLDVTFERNNCARQDKFIS